MIAPLTVVTPPRTETHGTGWAITIAGAGSVMLMSVVNFALQSDFRWILILPALAWVAGLLSYLAGQ